MQSNWYTFFQGESIGIEDVLEKDERRAPYIAAFGPSDDMLSDFKVVVEKDSIFSMPSIATAVHCAFACYYIYNISFTSDTSPLMLFLEQYVYKLKPSQKMPVSVSIIVDNLERVSS